MSVLMTDGPIIPIMQYGPDQPPVVPQISPHPTVVNLVPRITSALINEVGSKAYVSKARMHCYNVLANNYWQNDQLREAVKFAADYLALRGIKQELRALENGVIQTVALAMALYTGNLLLTIPELRGLVPNDHVQAALHNASSFNDIQTEISNMYGNVPQQGMVVVGYHPNGQPMLAPANQQMMHGGGMVLPQQTAQMQPQGMVVVGYHPNGQPIMAPAGQQMQPQQFQQPQFQQPQFQQPQFQQPQVMLGSPSFQNRPMTTAPAVRSVGGIDRGDTSHVEDRYASRPVHSVQLMEQPRSQQPQQQQVQQTQQAPIQQAVESYVTTLGGTEMDRNQHRINYYGHSHAVGSDDRSLMNALGNDCTEDDLKSRSVLIREWGLGVSQHECEINGRAKLLNFKAKRDTDLMVYRCYAVRVQPILSLNKEITRFAAKMFEEDINYIDLLQSVNAMTASLVGSLSSGDIDRDYATEILSMFTQMDRTLTDMINTHLAESLRIPFIKMGSFFEDGLGIVQYVSGSANPNSTMSNDLAVDLEEYIGKVTRGYFKSLAPELTEIVRENLNLDEAVVSVLPSINICMTYIELTASELGLDLKDVSLKIDATKTPALYKIVKNQATDDAKMTDNIMESYIITKDLVRYRVFRDALNNRSFFIKAV